MTTNTNYQGPRIAVPATMPSTTPAALQPFIKPLYIGMQALIQSLVRYAGIGPRNRDEYLYIRNDPSTILANNVHRFYTRAFEDIFPGALLNLFDSGGGVLEARLADATDPLKYCNAVYNGIFGDNFIPWATGDIQEVVIQEGFFYTTPAVPVVPGTSYYLATTPGEMTLAAPSGAGEIEQFIGFALTVGAMKFWPWPPILH